MMNWEKCPSPALGTTTSAPPSGGANPLRSRIVIFYCEKGSLVSAGNRCPIYDLKDKPIREIKSLQNDRDPFANFLDCIQTGRRSNSDVEERQKSTLLWHLGNIAWRVGHTLHLDPKSKRILNNPEANPHGQRECRPGWEPKVRNRSVECRVQSVE